MLSAVTSLPTSNTGLKPKVTHGIQASNQTQPTQMNLLSLLVFTFSQSMKVPQHQRKPSKHKTNLQNNSEHTGVAWSSSTLDVHTAKKKQKQKNHRWLSLATGGFLKRSAEASPRVL